MEIEKPCDTCIVLANCTLACKDFVVWLLKTKKTDFTSHPHFDTASISSDLVDWLSEHVDQDTIGLIFP